MIRWMLIVALGIECLYLFIPTFNHLRLIPAFFSIGGNLTGMLFFTVSLYYIVTCVLDLFLIVLLIMKSNKYVLTGLFIQFLATFGPILWIVITANGPNPLPFGLMLAGLVITYSSIYNCALAFYAYIAITTLHTLLFFAFFAYRSYTIIGSFFTNSEQPR
jgi:hypothetical protein